MFVRCCLILDVFSLPVFTFMEASRCGVQFCIGYSVQEKRHHIFHAGFGSQSRFFLFVSVCWSIICVWRKQASSKSDVHEDERMQHDGADTVDSSRKSGKKQDKDGHREGER